MQVVMIEEVICNMDLLNGNESIFVNIIINTSKRGAQSSILFHQDGTVIQNQRSVKDQDISKNIFKRVYRRKT